MPSVGPYYMQYSGEFTIITRKCSRRQFYSVIHYETRGAQQGLTSSEHNSQHKELRVKEVIISSENVIKRTDQVREANWIEWDENEPKNQKNIWIGCKNIFFCDQR